MTTPLQIEADSPAITAGTLSQNIGIDSGGILHPLLVLGTPVPAVTHVVLSTSTDGQTALDVPLLRGNRMMARDAHALGVFRVTGFPVGPPGIPQVTVTVAVRDGGIWMEATDADGVALQVERLS